ncbi:unnamed protein product [Owenia fusiformis]|uniref:Solute carrier organic anion transporter family member n=1 Tax=Owenia fusiformis TaxID=6347 RepID=A0A8J1TXR9_OWEFU|nr:unnamed protein product [Owenia fusiformis]
MEDQNLSLSKNSAEEEQTDHHVTETNKSKNDEYSDTGCGIGSWQPKCLQKFADIRIFVISLCLFGVCYGLFGTYLYANLSTIEKRFSFSSSTSGILLTIDNVALLPSCILVSHFGRHAHKPRIFFVASMLMVISMVFWTMPYLIQRNRSFPLKDDLQVEVQPTGEFNAIVGSHSNRTYQFIATNTPEEELCMPNRNRVANFTDGASANCGNEQKDAQRANTVAFGFFVVAQLFFGMGVAPFWTLGMTYIDDNASRKDLSFFLGLFFALRSLSPVLGYFIGAWATSYPEDLQPTDMTPQDPRWIGAWWLGFPVIAVLTTLNGIPMLFFPKTFKTPSDRKKANKEKNHLDDKKPVTKQAVFELKDLPKAIGRLLTNSVYIALVISVCLDVFVIVGWVAFVPKFLEAHFRVSTSMASIIAGTMGAFAVSLGTFASGWLASRLKTSTQRISAFICITSLAVTVCFGSLLAFRCPQTSVVGVNQSGNSSCIGDCACEGVNYEPVCGEDGLNYYSTCHAGCTSFVNETFSGCGCSGGGNVSPGLCPGYCSLMIPYAVISFVLTFVSMLPRVPLVRINLRCVNKDDRALAFGLSTCIISLFSLPSPVVYGNLLDGVCLVQKNSCQSGKKGACWLYATDPMRDNLHLLTLGLKFLTCFCYAFIWYKTRTVTILYDDDVEIDDENEEEKAHEMETKVPLM